MEEDPRKRVVEIVGGDAGTSAAYLSKVYDSELNKYYFPVPSNADFQEQLNSIHDKGFTGSGKSIAILDTGLLSHHPSLSNRIIESVDFTDSDYEDQNGHGTLVALLSVWASPNVSLYNVKVLDNEGYGTENALLKGIQWAMSKRPTIINISAGINSKKWWFWECKGTCKVCQAANEAVVQGIVVVVAAGNDPGITLCPATAGVKGESSVIAIEAFNMDLLSRAPYSGTGNVGAPSGEYILHEVN
jgi:subtilisin family serine protease